MCLSGFELYSRWVTLAYLFYYLGIVSYIASNADILGGSSRFLPHEHLLTWAEKNVDQSQQTSTSGKCTLDLEKFRAWLYSSRKDQKGLVKGEDLTVLEQTTQLTQKRFY